MKSTIFQLPAATTYDQNGQDHVYTFEIPLLSAFAIEYFTIQFGALSTFPSSGDTIQGSILTVNTEYNLDDMDCKVVIFYHGVRDYSLLFPNVTPTTLQIRLGEFYQEAEAAFDAGAWLTFMLMCGALFEGILFFHVGNNQSFQHLIQNAFSRNIIDNHTVGIMNKVRDYRNLVHANRHSQSYIKRADAMDTRITLDKLLREL